MIQVLSPLSLTAGVFVFEDRNSYPGQTLILSHMFSYLITRLITQLAQSMSSFDMLYPRKE